MSETEKNQFINYRNQLHLMTWTTINRLVALRTQITAAQTLDIAVQLAKFVRTLKQADSASVARSPNNGNANTLSGPIRRRSRPADVDTNTRVNASAAHAKTLPAGGLAQASAQAASADFRDKPWFFANFKRPDAEAKLSGKPPGSFVVRPASIPGCLSLTHVDFASGAVGHGLIKRRIAANGWSMEDESIVHSTVTELLLSLPLRHEDYPDLSQLTQNQSSNESTPKNEDLEGFGDDFAELEQMSAHIQSSFTTAEPSVTRPLASSAPSWATQSQGGHSRQQQAQQVRQHGQPQHNSAKTLSLGHARALMQSTGSINTQKSHSRPVSPRANLTSSPVKQTTPEHLSARDTWEALPSVPNDAARLTTVPNDAAPLTTKDRAESLRRPQTVAVARQPQLTQSFDKNALKHVVSQKKQESDQQIQRFTNEIDNVADKPFQESNEFESEIESNLKDPTPDIDNKPTAPPAIYEEYFKLSQQYKDDPNIDELMQELAPMIDQLQYLTWQREYAEALLESKESALRSAEKSLYAKRNQVQLSSITARDAARRVQIRAASIAAAARTLRAPTETLVTTLELFDIAQAPGRHEIDTFRKSQADLLRSTGELRQSCNTIADKARDVSVELTPIVDLLTELQL